MRKRTRNEKTEKRKRWAGQDMEERDCRSLNCVKQRTKGNIKSGSKEKAGSGREEEEHRYGRSWTWKRVNKQK